VSRLKFGFSGAPLALPRWSLSRGGRQAFHRDIRVRVQTNGPSLSAACRPTVFLTLTVLAMILWDARLCLSSAMPSLNGISSS
jgi:hypothetical protein